MPTDDQSSHDSDIITPLAVFLHGAAWLAVGWVLYSVVPPEKKVLEDFAVELPQSAIIAIRASDWVVNYFYLLVIPLALLLAFDAYALSSLRSRTSKVLWAAVGLLFPILVAGFVMLSIATARQRLMEIL